MLNDRGFEILPRTADIRMKVWGQTLQELFSNALRGIASYLKEDVFLPEQKDRKEKHALKIEAVDINSLLIDFLSEVIALSDIKNAIFTEVSFKEFGENFLEGTLLGVKTDGFDKDLKAVSYHEVDIKRNPQSGLLETILVFDI